ncbi:MAG: flavodoxin family protein [Spirochaetes bacterium]|uniref:Flavodoxin family protein n=1 Tax=Candidatus Ornithospirochaeta stercoravium TaxID=2840897 RepID=A0A9D9ICA8_9SPIO|nr:flavodoxin family protein [Candidatus Ornithospirochaeta stercoravium]
MTVVIAGSPRKGMYSDRLAEAYSSRKENSEIIYARSLKAGPCKACEYCHGKGNGICVQKDDMADALERIRKADEIALFSPIYWWQVTSQMKLVIDRLYAMDHKEWEGKKLTVVLNGATEDDDREFALLRNLFKEMADYLKLDFTFLGVGTTDDAAFEKAMEKVKNL